MEALWFALAAVMVAIYVVMDGFDFGAGLLHPGVAKTDSERRQVLAAIGPFWDGNEVWLLAAGGVLFLAFPKVLAAGLSGFYLAIYLLLWVLILRGIAIEFRSLIRDAMWRRFWDGTFAAASLLAPVLLGAALGNVLRGVPLGAGGTGMFLTRHRAAVERSFNVSGHPVETYDFGYMSLQGSRANNGLRVLAQLLQPRRALAGSYDEVWKATRWPRLPDDFDFAYWNCAPDDQQIDYPQGGELVKLVNLVAPEQAAEGSLAFRLPRNELKLLLHLDAGIPLFKAMNVDTLIIDAEAMKLTIVARCTVAAASGIEVLELGTWDVAAARARNATTLAEQQKARDAASVAAPEEAING